MFGRVKPLDAILATAFVDLPGLLIALLLLPAWLWWRRVPLLNARMATLALIGGIAYAAFVYAGFRYAPAAHGALLVSGLLPFTMALCVWLVLHERPHGGMTIGLLLIALGSGGIKPLVSAFVGDQFEDDPERAGFFGRLCPYKCLLHHLRLPRFISLDHLFFCLLRCAELLVSDPEQLRKSLRRFRV